MKKLLFLFIVSFSFLNAINEINEYKVDLYYANGIMMLESEDAALERWQDQVDDLVLFAHPELQKYIGKKGIAYNISKGMAADLFESFIQKTNLEPGYSIGWSAFKEFIGRTP